MPKTDPPDERNKDGSASELDAFSAPTELDWGSLLPDGDDLPFADTEDLVVQGVAPTRAELDELDDAIALLDRNDSLGPEDLERLASFLGRPGDLAGTVRLLRRAAELDPDNPQYARMLAQVRSWDPPTQS